jgi:aryl-alcohol dehydrogenase-like predicted oxidoreductase
MTVAAAAGTIAVGAATVNRLGYGAMQLTGPGIWGPPADPDAARAVLREAAALGVDFFDTADAYGPQTNEVLLAEALADFPRVVIATKGGLVRQGPGQWHPVGLPEYLRQCAELSLRRLGVEQIGLYQLHRIDARFPLADQVGVLAELRAEGKIRDVGLSEVTVDQLEQARQIVPISSVQNLYHLRNRRADPLLRRCEELGIAFIPWFPFGDGELARPDGPLGGIARATGIPAAQLALAWLLQRSPVMLPIPGTASLEHLRVNVGAAEVRLDADTVTALDAVG